MAVEYWPRKDDWPTSADIDRFISATEDEPDARLAVLSGLRRWAEPASSQMLLTVATIIVSIVAIALAVSDFGVLVHVGVVCAGVLYVCVAFFGIYLALGMDLRRKMAHVWLSAIEARLSDTAASARPQRPLDGIPGGASWWDRILQ